MRSVGQSAVSSLFGTEGQIGVNRGVAEFHARRPVLIAGGGQSILALPVEGLVDARRFARNFEDAMWAMWQARARKTKRK